MHDFCTNTLLFCGISAKFVIKCRNINLLNAGLSSVNRYYIPKHIFLKKIFKFSQLSVDIWYQTAPNSLLKFEFSETIKLHCEKFYMHKESLHFVRWASNLGFLELSALPIGPLHHPKQPDRLRYFKFTIFQWFCIGLTNNHNDV